MNGTQATGRTLDLPVNGSNVIWEHRTSRRGPYDIAKRQDTAAWRLLFSALQERKGSAVSDNYRYWICPDGSTICRREYHKEEARE
jgi:hypothetical protein